MVWEVILGVFLIIVAVVITTIVSVKSTKAEAKINVRPNAPLLLIRAERIKPHTEDYSWGIIKSQLKRKNKTTLIEFYPTDVEQGEFVPRPDVKSFVVRNEFIKRSAEGEGSARRQIITILPRDRTDLSKDIRSTVEGTELTKEGQLAFIESTISKMIPAGDEAIGEALTKYARGNVRKAVLQEMDNENKKIRSLIPPQQTPPPEHKTPP